MEQLNSGTVKQLSSGTVVQLPGWQQIGDGKQLTAEKLKPVVRDYKELIAYQKSYELAFLIYRLTDSFPKEEVYGLTSQIRRAVVSIPSNIAEGFMRGAKEYGQFLKIALSSAVEVETQLSLSKDLGYCGKEDYFSAEALTKEILRLMTSYITRVNERVNSGKKRKIYKKIFLRFQCPPSHCSTV